MKVNVKNLVVALPLLSCSRYVVFLILSDMKFHITCGADGFMIGGRRSEVVKELAKFLKTTRVTLDFTRATQQKEIDE